MSPMNTPTEAAALATNRRIPMPIDMDYYNNVLMKEAEEAKRNLIKAGIIDDPELTKPNLAQDTYGYWVAIYPDGNFPLGVYNGAVP